MALVTAAEPSSPALRPGDGTSGKAAEPWIVSAPRTRLLRRRSGGTVLLAPAELGAVDPDAMQHHAELARRRDPSPPRPAPFGHLHRPALERREAKPCASAARSRPAGRRTVERGAHPGVAGPGDRADAVGLARPMALRRQAEAGAERLRPREAAGIVDARPVGGRQGSRPPPARSSASGTARPCARSSRAITSVRLWSTASSRREPRRGRAASASRWPRASRARRPGRAPAPRTGPASRRPSSARSRVRAPRIVCSRSIGVR